MPTEPSIMSACRRYFYIALLGPIVGVLCVFIVDAMQPTSFVAESSLVLRQPREIGSDIVRTERFALEQVQIIESPAVAARAGQKVSLDQRSVQDSVSVETDPESNQVIVRYKVKNTDSSDAEARTRAVAGAKAVVDSYLEVSGQIAAEELRITEAVVDVQLSYLIEAIGDMYTTDLDAASDSVVGQLESERGRNIAKLSRSQTNALRRSNPLLQRVPPGPPTKVRLAGNKINLAMAFAIGAAGGALFAYGIALRKYFAEHGSNAALAPAGSRMVAP